MMMHEKVSAIRFAINDRLNSLSGDELERFNWRAELTRAIESILGSDWESDLTHEIASDMAIIASRPHVAVQWADFQVKREMLKLMNKWAS